MADLVGAYVGEFRVAEEYVGDVRVPGCLPNAICGIPICGTGVLCGASWACPYPPRLILGGGAFRLLDQASVELRVRKPVLTLRAKTVATVADQAPPARKPWLVLNAKQARLGIDQTLRVNKATLWLSGRLAWGHVPGLVATIPDEVILVPTVPEEEVLVPTVPVTDADEDWLLRPTEEESL